MADLVENTYSNSRQYISSAVNTILIKPVAFLNKYPILLKTKSYHFVNFGTFAMLGSMVTTFLFFFYLYARGYSFSLPLPLVSVFFIVGEMIVLKLFYIVVAWKKLSHNALFSLNETTMYNQGGVLGMVLVGIGVALLNNIPLLVMFDTLVISCTFSLFIGRIGCYNYGCCFGKPTKSIIHVVYHENFSKVIRTNPELRGIPLVPTQLYSAYFDLLLFVVCVILVDIFPADGVVSLVYLFLFNGFRIFIQRYRFTEQSDLMDFSKTAFNYMIGSFILWLFLFGYQGWQFVERPMQVPWTLTEGMVYVFNTPGVLVSIGVVGIITFLFYGVHGRRLGTHLNFEH